jgi:hypothetical protein
MILQHEHVHLRVSIISDIQERVMGPSSHRHCEYKFIGIFYVLYGQWHVTIFQLDQHKVPEAYLFNGIVEQTVQNVLLG